MKFQKFGIILLSFFLIVFTFDFTVSGEEASEEWLTGAEQQLQQESVIETVPDGAEGFETSVTSKKKSGSVLPGIILDLDKITPKDKDVSPEDKTDLNYTTKGIILDLDKITPDTEDISSENEDDSTSAEEIDSSEDEDNSTEEGEEATLEGVIDVDTYLNVRTGPWGKIVGGLYNGDKINIISKEGDWFKIKQGEEICYVHAYYVDAPGYPSHQGIEPPSGVGSNESPTGDPGSSPTVDNGTFGAEPVTPMPSSTSSDFGPRDLGGVGSTYHLGIDLPIPTGTQCNALGNGVVGEVGYDSGAGQYVWVHYDNGYSSYYCHLEGVSVQQGQRVAIGQGIATSDNTGTETTGPHLHMGVTDSSGSFVNPRDIPGLEFPPLVE